ncbi:MAG TPA: glycosyltransferase family 4 protein [Kiritimatiellia bacterium]|nr:glycosyltransferase family 4 protein [Kiritimatiellia bacterium]
MVLIYALLHDVGHYCPRSSFPPLLEQIECKVIPYRAAWRIAGAKSWTVGHWLRSWGNRYYGSQWNWWLPYVHEWFLSRALEGGPGDLVHFMMAEFGTPRYPEWFRGRGRRLVGTYHCSARRLEQVLARYDRYMVFDRITVMSRSQLPFFIEKGYPSERISVTMHGVDTDYFAPDVRRGKEGPEGHPGHVKLLLVGSTERDHEVASQVMRRVQDLPVHLDVLTASAHRDAYGGLNNVSFLSNLSNEDLVKAYQQADLLFMPLLDCTANNAILEAMACGTPVMVNNTGGIPEYVDASCNFVMEGKDADVWAEVVAGLVKDRTLLEARRPAVRAWAEQLDWRVVKAQYLRAYEAALAMPPIQSCGR